MASVFGIDIGAQKIIFIDQDGEIVRTDTGSVIFPNLIAFFGRSRLVGEEALPHITGENTISMINLLIGKSSRELKSLSILKHLRCQIADQEHLDSIGALTVNYCDEQQNFTPTALLAMLITALYTRVKDLTGSDIHLAFSLPPDSSPSVKRTVQESCVIAGINLDKVVMQDAVECLVKAYSRKISAIRDPERAALNGKKAVLIEVGHTRTTVLVVEITISGVQAVEKGHDASLGAFYFDDKLFEHFANICESKHGSKVLPGSKRGARLLSGTERLRKLLSQLPEAQVTVENLSDSGDVSFSMRRDEMATVCQELLERLRALIADTIGRAFGSSLVDLYAVEVLGGGARMQVVQAIISELVGPGVSLGAKLDDASVALGAALLSVPSSVPPETTTGAELSTEDAMDVVTQTEETQNPSIGLSEEELAAAVLREQTMRAIDQEVRAAQEAKNSIEALILDARGIPNRKHGALVDRQKVDSYLNGFEDWLWEQSEHASTEALNDQLAKLKSGLSELCASYLAAVEADRVATEQLLEEEAKKAEAERANADEDDEDKDFRKLKKGDRMRLVTKNKEEGNELWKGGNVRPAAARYHKALTHCAKFFDLSPDDEKEVGQVKLSLYLNLAQCYLKLENWEQAIRNCDDAIAIDASNAKGLFRRGSAHEARKDWEKAMADFKRAESLAPEDKLVAKAIDRIKKQMQKEKDKEKKMWGGVFG